MNVALSQDETERLSELYAFEILDTPEDPGFDRICNVATELFRVPIAIVAFADRNRNWYKARRGIEARQSEGQDSFTHHVIVANDLLVVEDASRDPRFNQFDIVKSGRLRFFAGAPLVVGSGIAIGSLSIASPEPRSFSPQDAELLNALAGLVIEQLGLHRAHLRLQRELDERRREAARMDAQSRLLQRREALLAQTARLARVGGWELDVKAMRLSWADEVFRIFEVEGSEPPSAINVLSYFPPATRLGLKRAIRAAVQDGEAFDLECPIITAQGSSRWVRLIGEVERERGRTHRIIGTCQDVSDRKNAEARIEHLAHHDALTGLPNRALFQDRLDQALRAARRARSLVALLLIDLDHFKDVNDSLGHDAGDLLLKVMADRLRQVLREGDTVARLGGDEFAVILTGIRSVDDVRRPAETIMASLRDPLDYQGNSVATGGSIGITIFPHDDRNPAQLFKNADIALYRAKAEGRGRCAFFTASMRRAIESRMRLSAEIRRGLEAQEFLLHYQPKVSLRSGAVTGFEALVRWQHPELGLVPPSSFSAVFEDNDLAVLLGNHVLEQALTGIRSWMDAGLEFGRVAINLAAAQFRAGDLAEQIEQGLARHGVPPSRFMIEVTESVFLGRGAEAVEDTLERLHALGVLIALDDFGTGYASLAHLKRFPVDRIKIDRSFVRDIGTDPEDSAIVRAVIGLGHSLGLEVVAEGVETVEQLDYLRLCGCDHAQGFHFARPLPAHMVPRYLESGPSFGSSAGRQVA